MLMCLAGQANMNSLHGEGFSQAGRVALSVALVSATVLLLPSRVLAEQAINEISKPSTVPATASERPSDRAFLIEAAKAQEATRAHISGFRFRGNTLLSTEELQQVVKDRAGERTLAELQEAASAVQQRYRQAGYGAVIAFLAQQKTDEAGTVLIQISEGKLEAVNVRGTGSFSPDLIRSALSGLDVGQTPRLSVVDAQIQMLNENPARDVRVLLQPGKSGGAVLANVDVQEQRVLQGRISLDNSGNERTGYWRTGFGFTHANLWGRDHVGSVDIQVAPDHPGRVQVLSGSYRVPFYAQRLLWDTYGAWSKVDGGQTPTPVGALSFNGASRILGARLQRLLPRWGEMDHRLLVELEHRSYLNACQIVGLPDGACGGAGVSVDVTPLSLQYLMQYAAGDGKRLLGHVGLHFNIPTGGSRGSKEAFSAVRSGASPSYQILRWKFSGTAPWAGQPGWQWGGHLDGQIASGPLVVGEQFALGGARAVRGYEERELQGDHGIQLSAEIHAPGWEWSKAPGWTLRGVMFTDVGHVRNSAGLGCRNDSTGCNAAAVGFGLRLAQNEGWLARLDLGLPLIDGTVSRKNRLRAHLLVSRQF